MHNWGWKAPPMCKDFRSLLPIIAFRRFVAVCWKMQLIAPNFLTDDATDFKSPRIFYIRTLDVHETETTLYLPGDSTKNFLSAVLSLVTLYYAAHIVYD